MPDYSKAIIYTIRNKNDTSLIYVGSTTRRLEERFRSHKAIANTNRYPNHRLYSRMKDNIDDWYIQLHQDYPCNSKEELLKKEAEVIRAIATLNCSIPLRTDAEYCKEDRAKNPEKYRLKKKKYRETHKEYIKERAEIRWTCECGCEIRWVNKAKHFRTEKHKNFTEQNAKEKN